MGLDNELLQKLPPKARPIDSLDIRSKTGEFKRLLLNNNTLAQIESMMLDNEIGSDYLSKAIAFKITEGYTCSPYEYAVYLMMEDIKELRKTPKEVDSEKDEIISIIRKENIKLKKENEYLKYICETVQKCLYDVVKGDK